MDETLEDVARGLASRMKQEWRDWAAGRVGDIDFTGPTKTRGKVKVTDIRNAEGRKCNWGKGISCTDISTCVVEYSL